MQCNSPLASIGFNIFPASIAPSVLPAPTIVWSSSMNKMIWPSLFLTSSSTAFKRSSNSPRYFAPATKEPISSEKIVLSFNWSGTSPRTIRCANPSTTAVLPTPGSPINTGLFFVFLDKIRTTLRISLSRPMTGSNFCSLALFTRSYPYFSRLSYVSSGLSLVTFCPPRICDKTCKKRSLVIPYARNNSLIALFGCLIIARNKCSTDTYSSFMAFISSSPWRSTWLRSLLIYTWPPDTFGFLFSNSCTWLKNVSLFIPIFSSRLAIKLSSIVSKLYKKCSWSISWCPWS